MSRPRRTRPGGPNAMDAIFDLWPSVAALAEDLGRNYHTVVSWRRRSFFPAELDTDLMAAAQRRKLPVSLPRLAKARKAVAQPEARGSGREHHRKHQQKPHPDDTCAPHETARENSGQGGRHD